VWKNALPVASSVSDLRTESVILYTYSVIGARIIKEPIPDLEINAATETKKFIDAHFSNPELTLVSVCEKLSYSPKYISSIFTKQYKTTLSKYLNSIRIEHACSLIERGHTSIKTVAFMCGFNDPLYFSKVFKAYRKVSPREFIKSIQTNQTK
jgi:AraC-like DNA-binding protein